VKSHENTSNSGRQPFGRPRRRRYDNIEMNLMEMVCEVERLVVTAADCIK
jgi:hypothetical protein